MADLNIDTTSAQYQQLLNGLPILRAAMVSRAPLLKLLARQKKKAALRQWLQRDPLLEQTIEFVEESHDFIEAVKAAVKQ